MESNKKILIAAAAIVAVVVIAVVAWQVGLFSPTEPTTPSITTPGDKTDKEVALQEEIETRYTDELTTMITDYEYKLNTMVNLAWSDYNQTLQEKSNFDPLDLAVSYISSGIELEKQCDEDFYDTLDKFESELSKNSLSSDKIEKAREEYEQKKADRKKELLKVLPTDYQTQYM